VIIQPVILSGGSGTRLWPLSREYYPKQLLALVGDDTLLQQTATRLDGLSGNAEDRSHCLDVAAPMLVCNRVHRYLVAEQLRKIDVDPAAIILEPVGRNTAPALTVAALEALDQGQDPVLLVMPADHVIGDIGAFHHAVAIGTELADNGRLVTFGVVPNRAHTGFGYLECGPHIGDGKAFELARFVEKPDQETAQGYLDNGGFLWNSGMFLMKASVWLEQAGRHCAPILEACRTAWAASVRSGEFLDLPEAEFGACPSDSIDYAVMEKVVPGDDAGSGGAAVVPLQAQWSDVGSADALWEVSAKDESGNALKGDVFAQDCRDSLVIAEHRFVATIGLEDMVVIETADAVVVLPKSRSQDIKKVVERLKAEQRCECETHRRVYRPWGTYEPLDQASRFQVKRIVVNPGAAISLQMHHHRAEHWVVVKGTAKVYSGDDSFLLTENQSTFIPLGTTHRLENPGIVPLEIIEIQSGSYLGEDDIVRFEDVYGRS
jgi:mannose-1-phosphate guanylyltransferase/mannose-6-phosphate isomerase